MRTSEPGYQLSLTAVDRPFGAAVIDLVLPSTRSGTAVTRTEEPVSGPGGWMHDPLRDALIRRRNVESLPLLSALVLGRTAP